MRNNFVNLLTQRVEIPIIQRDFAQGRTDSKTTKIRKDFLEVLFGRLAQRIENPTCAALELDFIYGFTYSPQNHLGAFVPIDGQQRLTTLWLLYWYVGVKEAVADQEMAWLRNFHYETRHSTSVFCKGLLAFRPGNFQRKISEEIKDQHWYFDTWEFDAGIQAMLVMIDDIALHYDQLGAGAIWEMIAGENCPFHFYQLDMGRVGLTDDLYIKMNSRGKSLTEFEYFKAGFTEILGDPAQKARFSLSVDQNWIDMVWTLVESSGNAGRGDIAISVDQSFLNLFNFITHVMARQAGVAYRDTVNSAAALRSIYSEPDHQDFLFDVLDAIHHQQLEDAGFWGRTFYFGKHDDTAAGVRLFFQHGNVNLVERCLFQFSRFSGFTMAEQLLLHACFVHFILQVDDFEDRIRVVRNLVVNSENELRNETLGSLFSEVEQYMQNGDLSVFENFKKDQTDEEKRKEAFLQSYPAAKVILHQLEDCDIFRGSISVFELDAHFAGRANAFLVHFGENGWEDFSTFKSRSNFLLSFGDYSQYGWDRTNLMTNSQSIVRKFFTTPGYTKRQLLDKTKQVLADGLDYLVANPSKTLDDRIQERLNEYRSIPKDWKYYFLRYGRFRERCNQGYYEWGYADHYPRYKMKEWKKTGYHWNPFLYELEETECSAQISLENFANPLYWRKDECSLRIYASQSGFQIENGNYDGTANTWLDKLILDGHIEANGEFRVQQTEEGIDLEDRVEKLRIVLCENHLGDTQP